MLSVSARPLAILTYAFLAWLWRVRRCPLELVRWCGIKHGARPWCFIIVQVPRLTADLNTTLGESTIPVGRFVACLLVVSSDSGDFADVDIKGY